MQKYILIILIATTVVNATASITEIHFNPQGGDNTKEYVEVDTANLSSYKIGDTESNDTLEKTKNGTTNTALIVEEGYNITTQATIYIAGATIGNGLVNGGDSIFLYDNTTMVDSLQYKGGQEGVSVHRVGDTTKRAKPSPGLVQEPPCNVSLTTKLISERIAYSEQSTVKFQTRIHGSANYSVKHIISGSEGEVLEVINQTSRGVQHYTVPKVSQTTKVQVFSEYNTERCSLSDSVTFLVQDDTSSCATYRKRLESLSEKLTNLRYLLSEQPRIKRVTPVSPDINVTTIRNTSSNITFRITTTSNVSHKIRIFRADIARAQNMQGASNVTLPYVNGSNTFLFVGLNSSHVYDLDQATFTFNTSTMNQSSKETASRGTAIVHRVMNLSAVNTTAPARDTSIDGTGYVIYKNETVKEEAYVTAITGAVTSALYGLWELITQEIL